ncbi:MAG: hypothetical protein JWN40_2967 [Phycisphaerales bacterium]|nr:hypothetical protein [Phycisphaerales bacterium]
MKTAAAWITLVALAAGAPLASAQVAAVAREIVEQGVEQIFKSAGREAVEELGKTGGRVAVRETLERAAAEGGEGLVRKTTAYGIEQGPIALRAIGRSPAKMVGALDNLAAELRPAALRAVERDPQALAGLVERYGAQALEAAAKQPGVGTVLGEKLGGEGLAAARSLTTDQAIVVARHADEIAKLPAEQQAGLFARLRSNAAGVTGFLERHPKTLLTAAGVAVILGAKDEILGPGDGADASGHAIGRREGLVPRVWHDVLGLLTKPIGAIATLLVGLAAIWAGLKVWAMWRRRQIQVRVAEARGQVEMERLAMASDAREL